MPRLTSADVIAAGDYLQPGFDANKLTTAQIRAVLLHHGVTYPTNCSKPQLVQEFNSAVSQPSTRQHRSQTEPPTQPALSHPVQVGEESSGSGARSQTAYGHGFIVGPESTESPSRSGKPPHPPFLGERSGPISANVFQPSARGSSRPKASNQGIPMAVGTASGGPGRLEDSGWVNNNIFQSGSKRSPGPHRPAREKTSVSLPAPSGGRTVADNPRRDSGWINNSDQIGPIRSPGPSHTARRKTGTLLQAPCPPQTVTNDNRKNSGFNPSSLPHWPAGLPKNSNLTNEAPRTRVAQRSPDGSHAVNGSGGQSHIRGPNTALGPLNTTTDGSTAPHKPRADAIPLSNRMRTSWTSPPTRSSRRMSTLLVSIVIPLIIVPILGMLCIYMRESKRIGFCDSEDATNTASRSLGMRTSVIMGSSSRHTKSYRVSLAALWRTPPRRSFVQKASAFKAQVFKQYMPSHLDF
ncbi:uncharacterized protein B0H18DRAFT_957093 [Fomitopsis serialis]|uniref:uncharacterized protein n=1 Tax=Fomitopsis serialis TaxID=139415 RepID=UPI0020089599|nr:uncharacterized protein B0H18DRAFT_957093 [Neoantrodia serialis]KAH9920386.1 hypothetical protein B0H18DRAFT_957093 [Neoantrodia serialis]